MSRYKIVMLPTDEATNIVRVYSDVEKSKFRLVVNAEVNDVYKEYVHLYIVDTKATIEVGDYLFISELNKITQANYLGFSKDEQSWHVKRNGFRYLCDKVIASTDISLGLSTIPQHLIDGVIEHGIDNIVIEDCYYAGDVFTIRWTEKPDFDLGDKIDAEFERYRQISKPQVDFDLLKQGIENIGCFVRLSDKERANMLLFFELEEVKRIINNLQV